MQFLGILGVIILAMFLGTALVPQFIDSYKNVSLTSINRSATQTSYSERLASRKIEVSGQVAGASIADPRYLEEGIVATLGDLKNVSRFQKLFDEANGGVYMRELTQHTLFVPTDEAFAKLSYSLKVELNTLNTEELKRFVTYHMVPLKIVSVGGQRAGVVTAISRDEINFELNDTGGTVGNAHVVSVHHTENGVIYVIDEVLLPPERRVELSTY